MAQTVIDAAMASKMLNMLLPTNATGGNFGTWSALTSPAKLKLTSTLSTASASGTEIAGTGYTAGGTAFSTQSTASSAGSNVTLPATSAISWTNTSGSAWSIASLEITDSAPLRVWWGPWNGQPIGVANLNTFQVAASAISPAASESMPITPWTAPVPPLGAAAGATVNTAALVDATPAPPPEFPPIPYPGCKIRVRAFGDCTTTATGANITWGLYWGAPYSTAIGSATVLAASAATASVNTSSAAWPWWLEWEGVVRALTTTAGGATGSVYGQGLLWSPLTLTTLTAAVPFPVTAALRTVSVDTSQNAKLMLGITLSGTTGAPALTCQDFNAELIG